MKQPNHKSAFTLVELLVVIAVMALLAGMLLPALARARLQAKLTTVHSDLRQIEMALEAYAIDRINETVKYPPCHFGCAMGNQHCMLPPELLQGRYLTSMREDPFNPGYTYKYEHPGPGFFGTTPSIRGTWVQDSFPEDDGGPGREYFAEKDSPVKYAVWSVGPDRQLALPYVNFDLLHFPVPARYWYPKRPIVTWYDGSWQAHTERRRGIVCHVFDGRDWIRSGMWSKP